MFRRHASHFTGIGLERERPARPSRRAPAASQIVEYPREPPISSTRHPGREATSAKRKRPVVGRDLPRALRGGQPAGTLVAVLGLEPREHCADAFVEHQSTSMSTLIIPPSSTRTGNVCTGA